MGMPAEGLRAALPERTRAGYRFQHERIPASARLLISIASFATMWLAASGNPSYRGVRPLLLFYFLYSLIIVAIAFGFLSPGETARKFSRIPFVLNREFSGRLLTGSLAALIHIADLAWSGLICLLTGGLNSPFVFLFVFVLTAAAYQWGGRGIMATAAAATLFLSSLSFFPNSPPMARFHLAATVSLANSLAPAASLLVLAGLLYFFNWDRTLADAPSNCSQVTANRTPAVAHHREAASAERRRIARDLHDGVIQSLIVLEMQISLLRRGEGGATAAAEALSRAQEVIRQDICELRELIEELRSDSPPDHLRLCVAEIVEKFRSETGISTSLSCDMQGECISPRIAGEVAGIVREALSNVRKHSRANRVEVILASHQDRWELVVEDDGHGFDFSGRLSQEQLETANKGPRVIQERVHSLNGELVIESYPNRGARLEVRFGAYE